MANGVYEVTVQIGNIDPKLGYNDKVMAFLKVNNTEFFYKKEVPKNTFVIETKKVEVDEYLMVFSNPCTSKPECEFDSTQLLNVKIKSVNVVGNSPIRQDLGHNSFIHKDCFTEDPINCIYRQAQLS